MSHDMSHAMSNFIFTVYIKNLKQALSTLTKILPNLMTLHYHVTYTANQSNTICFCNRV